MNDAKSVVIEVVKHLTGRHDQESHASSIIGSNMKISSYKYVTMPNLKEKGLTIQVYKQSWGESSHRYIISIGKPEGFKDIFSVENKHGASMYVDSSGKFTDADIGTFSFRNPVKSYKSLKPFLNAVKSILEVDFPDYKKILEYVEK